MTGSVTSKSTVSSTCALAEETVRLRRRRTGVPSCSVSIWAEAAKTKKRVPARRMINLDEINRARRLPKHTLGRLQVPAGPAKRYIAGPANRGATRMGTAGRPFLRGNRPLLMRAADEDQ